MAKVTFVPMNYLIERGQQIKVFSQITRQTRKENMLVKANVDEKSNESFVGATVLNAKKGAYMDKVVTGLDFASLYPSIMRAHNLCYNTIVLDKTYDNLPDIEYETVSGQLLTIMEPKATIGTDMRKTNPEFYPSFWKISPSLENKRKRTWLLQKEQG